MRVPILVYKWWPNLKLNEIVQFPSIVCLLFHKELFEFSKTYSMMFDCNISKKAFIRTQKKFATGRWRMEVKAGGWWMRWLRTSLLGCLQVAFFGEVVTVIVVIVIVTGWKHSQLLVFYLKTWWELDKSFFRKVP